MSFGVQNKITNLPQGAAIVKRLRNLVLKSNLLINPDSNHRREVLPDQIPMPPTFQDGKRPLIPMPTSEMEILHTSPGGGRREFEARVSGFLRHRARSEHNLRDYREWR